MTPAESIALAVLQHYSGVWYTSETDSQRHRVLRDATAAIEPMLAAHVESAVMDLQRAYLELGDKLRECERTKSPPQG